MFTGLPSGIVIETIDSMHVSRECISAVQKNFLHRVSFRHSPIANTILTCFLSLRKMFTWLAILQCLTNQCSKFEGPTIIFKMYKVLLKIVLGNNLC